MEKERIGMSEYMPIMEVLEKVREGCERYMYRIDDEGQCAEADDYVVALFHFEDYIEWVKWKQGRNK